MIKISLSLTKEEADKLEEALENYDDCGPMSYGWKSDELSKVSAKVSDAITEARKCLQ